MQNPKEPTIYDRPMYTSTDGQVSVVIKKHTANRFPQHGYPIVCLLVRQKPHTRIQLSKDDPEIIDICLTNREFTAFFEAARLANPDHKKTVEGIALDKDPERKKTWDAKNQQWHEGSDS